MIDDDNFQVHCVLDRNFSYLVAGERERLGLKSGDVLLPPRGGATSMCSRHAGNTSIPGHHSQTGILGERQATPASRVIVLGGKLEFAGQSRHPLISGLTDITLVRRTDLSKTGTRRHAGFLINRALSDYPDTSSPILNRLFEILLLQVISAHYAAVGLACVFMAASHDQAVSSAIVPIHENPA